MKIKHLLLATVLLASAASQAQDSTRAARPITLNEAVDLGIKNSHQLKNSTAKIEEATAAVREALDGRLPSAKASGSYLRVNNPSIKMKAEDNSGGGSNPDEPSTTPKVSQAMYGLVNFSLPVYTGGKIRYGIESSRLLAEATRLDAEHQREEVTQNIIEAYINLYKAKAAVDLVKENLAQNEQRVKDFRNLEKNGILARNDLLKAELQASNTELTLLDVENSWALANVNMDLMLGLPATTLLAPDSSITEVTTAVLPLDDYVTAALKGRKDIGAISLQRRASDNSVKIAKADKYPSLALTGGYVALDVPKFIAVTNAVNLGVGVSYDIASLWKNKAKVQQAEARSRQLEQNEAMIGDQVILQVNKSYLDLLSSRKKIDVYSKAVEQAQENYRITKNKYDNSLATTTDLLDADVASLQAKLNYVFAKADAVVAYDKLLQTAGMPVQ